MAWKKYLIVSFIYFIADGLNEKIYNENFMIYNENWLLLKSLLTAFLCIKHFILVTVMINIKLH